FSQAFLQSDKEKVSKFYQAIVKGIVKDDEMMIEIPLGKEGDDLRRKKMTVEQGGQTAKTSMKVLERFPEEDLTLIELELFKAAVDQAQAPPEDDEEDPPPAMARPVGFAQRAFPLLDMLRAAAAKQADVTWGL
ncbi:MAG: DUF1840 family protein, partial [Shewanella sp.]